MVQIESPKKFQIHHSVADIRDSCTVIAFSYVLIFVFIVLLFFSSILVLGMKGLGTFWSCVLIRTFIAI